ncbi:amino acid ABC transporter permease [Azospirillum endophyticum]
MSGLSFLLPTPDTPLGVLIPWLPMMVKGFGLNLLISFQSMALGLALGIALGAAQGARSRPLALAARGLTLFFRNSPWLVILFWVMFVAPFQFKLFGTYWRFPDWIKAVVALSVPVAGYMAEILRGGLKAVPDTQWDAAAALGYGRLRTLTTIILPQAARLMVPPTMNLYCTLTMATSLANIVGVQDLMTVTQNILSTERMPGLILPAYGITLLLFFVYVFPVSLFSRALERRWTPRGRA